MRFPSIITSHLYLRVCVCVPSGARNITRQGDPALGSRVGGDQQPPGRPQNRIKALDAAQSWTRNRNRIKILAAWLPHSPTGSMPHDFGPGPLPHSPTPTAYPAISPKERRYRAYRIICQPGRYRADLPTWYHARHEKIRHLDGTGSRSKRRAYRLSRSNLINKLRPPQITSIMTIAIFHLHFPQRAGCAFV